jgi:pimeloyl-ACP methyl ester carboxylesterase
MHTGCVRNATLALVAIVGVLLAGLWAFQRHLIYLPSRAPVPRAGEVTEGWRDVALETSDGLRLDAWFVPARAPATDFTVLVANGNAGDRSLRAPLARALAREGFAVLLFDYRGYGGNPGQPSEEGLARDARAAYRFLVGHEGLSPERLIFFGESLGAAVVTELATAHPPGGLLLRSPFTDLAAVGRIHYPFVPVGLLLRDRYPVVAHVRRVDVPTTVVYGTRDSIVPPEQSRAVAEAAAGPTTVVAIAGADHNDPALGNGREVTDAVVALAARIAPSV